MFMGYSQRKFWVDLVNKTLKETRVSRAFWEGITRREVNESIENVKSKL